MTERLEGEVRTALAVIGGGYLGFSTALHLAEAGHEVTVLEADEPGFGASGRNTGFAVPNLLTGLDPRDVKKQFGEARGHRLCRNLGAGWHPLLELTRRTCTGSPAQHRGWVPARHPPAP